MLNVAVVMGRLVADPELRHTPSDVAVTSFTLAVDRSYVKSGAERQTDFIDIVAWRGTAEFVCKYFRKGPDDGGARLDPDAFLYRPGRQQAQGL